MEAGLRVALLAALLAAATPARAVVGGREAPDPGSAVMVLSSKGGVCTGSVLGPDTVLTAAHCVAGAGEHRVHYKDAAGTPVLVELAARTVHPGYDAGAVAGRRRSVDLALLRTATPLPARFIPATLSAAMPRAGESLSVSGYGVSVPGVARTTGTFRTADLAVVEPYGPSRILVWLKPEAGRAGPCQGDSGGPVAAAGAVVAVSAWVGGGACGGLAQGILLEPQRAWIDATLGRWGAAARWSAP